MQYAASINVAVQPDDRNDAYDLIVSDLASLIEHVQASLQAIERTIAQEASLGNEDPTTDIFVLDDVTPRYAKAGAALKACDADLGAALDFLLDSRAERGLN